MLFGRFPMLPVLEEERKHHDKHQTKVPTFIKAFPHPHLPFHTLNSPLLNHLPPLLSSSFPFTMASASIIHQAPPKKNQRDEQVANHVEQSVIPFSSSAAEAAPSTATTTKNILQGKGDANAEPRRFEKLRSSSSSTATALTAPGEESQGNPQALTGTEAPAPDKVLKKVHRDSDPRQKGQQIVDGGEKKNAVAAQQEIECEANDPQHAFFNIPYESLRPNFAAANLPPPLSRTNSGRSLLSRSGAASSRRASRDASVSRRSRANSLNLQHNTGAASAATTTTTPNPTPVFLVGEVHRYDINVAEESSRQAKVEMRHNIKHLLREQQQEGKQQEKHQEEELSSSHSKPSASTDIADNNTNNIMNDTKKARTVDATADDKKQHQRLQSSSTEAVAGAASSAPVPTNPSFSSAHPRSPYSQVQHPLHQSNNNNNNNDSTASSRTTAAPRSQQQQEANDDTNANKHALPLQSSVGASINPTTNSTNANAHGGKEEEDGADDSIPIHPKHSKDDNNNNSGSQQKSRAFPMTDTNAAVDTSAGAVAFGEKAAKGKGGKEESKPSMHSTSEVSNRENKKKSADTNDNEQQGKREGKASRSGALCCGGGADESSEAKAAEKEKRKAAEKQQKKADEEARKAENEKKKAEEKLMKEMKKTEEKAAKEKKKAEERAAKEKKKAEEEKRKVRELAETEAKKKAEDSKNKNK